MKSRQYLLWRVVKRARATLVVYQILSNQINGYDDDFFGYENDNQSEISLHHYYYTCTIIEPCEEDVNLKQKRAAAVEADLSADLSPLIIEFNSIYGRRISDHA